MTEDRRPGAPAFVTSLVLGLAAALALAACGGIAPEVAVSGTLVKRAPTEQAATVAPETLATRLSAVEAAIRDPATSDAELDRLGREQQTLYRTLGDRPELVPTVVDQVSAEVRAAVQANATADAELNSLGVPGAELPHWSIVAPAPPATLVAEYKAAGDATGVPWQFLAAIHLVETRMSRIRGNSSAGAQGPMQFIPATWSIYGAGGDVNSDHDAIHAAADTAGGWPRSQEDPDMTDRTRRPGADGALPAAPAWFNLDAVADEDARAELAHLADEVEAMEQVFVAGLAARCFRALKTIDLIPINPDGTFGEVHELLRTLSGAERLGDALYRLAAHAAAACGERPDLPALDWIKPVWDELGLDDCGVPVSEALES